MTDATDAGPIQIGKNGSINVEVKIDENKLNTILNKLTFELFFKETKAVEILAEDNKSGTGEYYYYISDD